MTMAYKQRVIQKVAQLRGAGNGAVGAYLRSEGLYYSSVRKWEKLAAEGKLGASKASEKAHKDRQSSTLRIRSFEVGRVSEKPGISRVAQRR